MICTTGGNIISTFRETITQAFSIAKNLFLILLKFWRIVLVSMRLQFQQWHHCVDHLVNQGKPSRGFLILNRTRPFITVCFNRTNTFATKDDTCTWTTQCSMFCCTDDVTICKVGMIYAANKPGTCQPCQQINVHHFDRLFHGNVHNLSSGKNIIHRP